MKIFNSDVSLHKMKAVRTEGAGDGSQRAQSEVLLEKAQLPSISTVGT
ncbi:hypothetical protein [Desulfosporosinus hippei]|nr:hypothetical protein [Desulfosporosinus hippei]